MPPMKWLLTFLLLVPLSAQRRITVLAGYMKAEEFPDLAEPVQDGYARGFINGLMISPALGADHQEVRQFYECTKEMDSKQVAAIINKYIKDHPEVWHQELAVESLNAILKVCPKH